MTRTKNAPYDFNRAQLPPEDTNNGRNRAQEMEQRAGGPGLYRVQVVAFDRTQDKGRDDVTYDGRFATVVDARFYMGRRKQASQVHCSVWVRTRDGRYFAGNGSAGGWGYHKASAALDEALTSAGIKLAKPIHGCGDGAMKWALDAVAKAAGYARLPRTIID